MSKVYIVSDTHFPYHDKKAYAKMLKSIAKEKPNYVIQIGDLLDQYVFSKYSKDVGITPDADIRVGVQKATDFWLTVKRIVPKAKCHQLLGNHDVRLRKRVAEKIPELASLIEGMNLYKFPSVISKGSDRDYIVIDGVVYCHGWLSKSIDHAKYFNQPTVHGHRHRPEIATDGELWSMDVGFLADVDSKPLSYTMSKFCKWKLACGVVEDGKHPRLIFL